MVKFLHWLARRVGIVTEYAHHIEADFFKLAERFEVVAERETASAVDASIRALRWKEIQDAASVEAAKASARARKVREFFA